MKIDFNQIINRKNTNSLKYDFTAKRGKAADILPLWVADMDFPTAPAITEALKKACEHGIFGYSDTTEEYFYAVRDWFSSHYNWEIERKWLVKTPGVVFAVCMAIRAFTEKGDAVLIQRPVYYPFSESVIVNERRLINNPLVNQNGRYVIDFTDFERKIVDNNVKLFLLCNPHNPVGRVFTKEELEKLGDLCMKYNVLVVSDEIHADFIYPGYRHIPFASLKPEYLSQSITCTAPSKTFNLAGLQISNIIIQNPRIKAAFKAEVYKTGYCELNTMGIIAGQTAYRYGEEWLTDLKKYLLGNLDYLRSFLQKELPQLKLIEPEGTYLVWIDCRALRLSDRELDNLVSQKAKLWLDEGPMFGPEGSGYQRINIACPRKILIKALNQLKNSLEDIPAL